MATSAQPRPSDPSPASCVDGCVARVRTTGEERGCSYALRPCAGLRHAATFMPYLQCRARQLRASLAVCVCVLFRSTCADYLCTPPVPAGQIQGGGDKNGCHAQRVHRHRLRPMCWALPCTRTRPLLSRRQWRCHMRASYVHSECMHDPRHRRRLCVVCACMIVHRKLVRGRRVGGHV